MSASVKTTLFVRHLPPELTPEEKEDFLKHFGALSVRCMPESGRMKNSAFAIFSSDEAAEQALSRLHQLDVFNSRLQVQFAKEEEKRHFPHIGSFKKPVLKENTPLEVPKKHEDFNTKIEAMQRNINSMSMLFGLNYPLNPKLRYRYPPPTTSILTNIAHTLAAVPKFYIQVLHLMNKMNLPVPFGPVTQTPPMKERIRKRRQTSMTADNMNEAEMEMTSTESELETEEDDEKPSSHAPPKLFKNIEKRIKRLKMTQRLQKTTWTPRDPTAVPLPAENVFEVPEAQETKKIEFKLNLVPLPTDATKEEVGTEPDSSQVNEDSESATLIGGFGQFMPRANLNAETDGKENAGTNEGGDSKFLSRSEIRKNRLSKTELKKFAVFKNYESGDPTTRLYIKNLAKQVEENDLRRIYGYYVDQKSEVESNMFDIRLMKEGRMKGQAFVTLPDESKAETALEDTNGYLLHGKPLVVQFARSARPKETTKSTT